MTPRRHLAIALPVVAAVVAWAAPQSRAQLTVFDPASFQQNLLSAARALEQINNQVRLLQNQALMIARMDQNLVRLGPTLSPDLQRTLSALQAQLTAGEGIALRLSATQSAYEQLLPKQASAALTHDDALRSAKARWDEAYAVFPLSCRAGSPTISAPMRAFWPLPWPARRMPWARSKPSKLATS
jgi:P-type conjugative transfer protein TrbJ